MIERLTFVTDGPHFGGAEQYIVAMSRAARRRGIDPHIYWMPLPVSDPDVFNATRASDLHVTTVEPQKTSSLAGLIRQFRTMLQSEQPDALVINACGRPRFWMLPWLAWQAGIPSVWVQQMVDGRDHRRDKPKWFGGRLEGPQFWRIPQTFRHQLAASAASAVITLNAEDRERIVRWHAVRRDKIRVVPHGVDCERFRFDPLGRERLRAEWGIGARNPSNTFVVGTAGRLVTGKGMDLLIEATALLRKRAIPTVAVIAGQGAERDALEQLAQQRGIAEAVKFIDFVEDMPAFYSALDVFALCSTTESFGLALAEAMACERPVVATPTAGAMRQIDHQQNGWQLEGFSPEELAEALKSMSGEPKQCQNMGTQSRPSVLRHFSIDLNLERTLRALRGPAGERSTLHWPGMNDALFAGMATEDLA